MDSLQTGAIPEVSIVIPAWNEEINIIRCVDSLSRSKSRFKFEIVIVDNNSSDNTAEVLSKLNVVSLSQPKQGVGPARQLGQEHARGAYILMADADCFYSPYWVDIMTENLIKKEVVCVYGNYSFITQSLPEKLYMYVYEQARFFLGLLRRMNRPFLNCLGMSMGYEKKYGLEIGFIENNIRGEDGRLAYSLMNYGKIEYVCSKKSKVWTGNRTLQRQGKQGSLLFKKVKKELGRFGVNFKPVQDHDPKTTSSEKNPSASE